MGPDITAQNGWFEKYLEGLKQTCERIEKRQDDFTKEVAELRKEFTRVHRPPCKQISTVEKDVEGLKTRSRLLNWFVGAVLVMQFGIIVAFILGRG